MLRGKGYSRQRASCKLDLSAAAKARQPACLPTAGSFSGVNLTRFTRPPEVKVSRKHTSFLLRDLPTLLGGALGQLVSRWKTMDRRVEAYKGCGLADFEVNDLTIRALDASVLSASRIPDLLHEYRQPKHKAFEPRSLWSFFNAGTEVLKGALHMLPRRSQALHQICDQFVGLN